MSSIKEIEDTCARLGITSRTDEMIAEIAARGRLVMLTGPETTDLQEMQYRCSSRRKDVDGATAAESYCWAYGATPYMAAGSLLVLIVQSESNRFGVRWDVDPIEVARSLDEQMTRIQDACNLTGDDLADLSEQAQSLASGIASGVSLREIVEQTTQRYAPYIETSRATLERMAEIERQKQAAREHERTLPVRTIVDTSDRDLAKMTRQELNDYARSLDIPAPHIHRTKSDVIEQILIAFDDIRSSATEREETS